MDTLGWIVTGGLLMSAIALVGGLTTLLHPATLERILLPTVALATGTLLGGASFHMVPEGLAALDTLTAMSWLACGFSAFFALEQFIHLRHLRRTERMRRQPMTYLVLIGDGIHNFLGGLGIASTFIVSPQAGVIAWIGAVAHEIPQEFGDFGVLVHGGWPRRQALLWNLLSALTFPLGALLAYFLSLRAEMAGLVMFAAGNFLYLAAADLIPELKSETRPRAVALNFAIFAAGLGLMLVLAWWFHD